MAFRLKIRGRSGHGSTPSIADNALVKAAEIIGRLERVTPVPAPPPEATAFMEATLGEVVSPEEAHVRLQSASPDAAAVFERMLSLSIAPTQITASDKRNVIPGTCELTYDCRALPGQTREDILQLVSAAFGDEDVSIEWIESLGGSRSPIDGPLAEAMRRFVGKCDPGARLAPILLPGFTDSHYLREYFGTVAYGFFPMRHMSGELAATLYHSDDERASVEDLEFATRFLIDIASDLLGP